MVKSNTRQIMELGSALFILFDTLLNPNRGFREGGSIQFLAKVTILKETFFMRREELEDSFGLNL